MTPTIYLTSAGAVSAVRRGHAKPETATCVGPGRALSIMRYPKAPFGSFDGRVLAFTPPARLLNLMFSAKNAAETDAAWPVYEAGVRALWETQERVQRASPGSLAYGRVAAAHEVHDPGRARWDGEWWIPVGIVGDGDTLTCGCSAVAARAGRCHRVIAADLLKRAGWSVVLDGIHVYRPPGHHRSRARESAAARH